MKDFTVDDILDPISEGKYGVTVSDTVDTIRRMLMIYILKIPLMEVSRLLQLMKL